MATSKIVLFPSWQKNKNRIWKGFTAFNSKWKVHGWLATFGEILKCASRVMSCECQWSDATDAGRSHDNGNNI